MAMARGRPAALPDGVAPSARRRLGLAVAIAAGAGTVLLALFAASRSTVAADGTLVEPFGLLALGTLALTGAGLLGLAWLFRDIRRRSTCGRGRC
jgi:hypothetical protein